MFKWDKKTNKDLQNTTQKAKDWATQLKTINISQQINFKLEQDTVKGRGVCKLHVHLNKPISIFHIITS